MNGKDYITTQMRLLEIGKIAETLDLDAFISQINTAETMGPMLDPSLFIRAQASLSAIKRLAEAVQPVKVVFAETFQAIMKTQAAEFARNIEKGKDPS